MADTEPDEPHDAEDIDREIRINELKCQAEEMAGGNMATYESEDAPSEFIEGFWGNVVDFESAPDTSHHEQLRKDGIEVPRPESLSDTELTAKLWEIIHTLAARDTYLSNTDHLSDRELYTLLVDDLFHEITKDFPPGSGWNNHLDIIGSGSEEDIETHLRYYADDEWREHWAKQFPQDVIPPKEKPPHERDRQLPKSPFG